MAALPSTAPSSWSVLMTPDATPASLGCRSRVARLKTGVQIPAIPAPATTRPGTKAQRLDVTWDDEDGFRVARGERCRDTRQEHHRQRLRRDRQARIESAQPEYRLVVERQREEDTHDGESHRQQDQRHQRVVAILEDRERE